MSIGQTPHGNRTKRIGVTILKVLAENALKNIPVYGFYLGIGIDILKEVKAEIDKDRPLTKEEMIASLRLLTPSEVEKITDAVFRSPTGVQATAGLASVEREAVRQQLKNLPSEFEHLLAEIEDREKKEAERAAQDEQRRRDEEFVNLQNKLKTQLRDNKLKPALGTVEQMLGIKPHDTEARRIEAFLHKRVGELDQGTFGCFLVVAEMATLIGIIGLSIAHTVGTTNKTVLNERFNAFPSPILLLPFVFFCLMHFIVIPWVWPVVPRGMRKFLGYVGYSIIVVCILLWICIGIMNVF
jgi:hypothetical protein